jgi:hypothetical protein
MMAHSGGRPCGRRERERREEGEVGEREVWMGTMGEETERERRVC